MEPSFYIFAGIIVLLIIFVCIKFDEVDKRIRKLETKKDPQVIGPIDPTKPYLIVNIPEEKDRVIYPK